MALYEARILRHGSSEDLIALTVQDIFFTADNLDQAHAKVNAFCLSGEEYDAGSRYKVMSGSVRLLGTGTTIGGLDHFEGTPRITFISAEGTN